MKDVRLRKTELIFNFFAFIFIVELSILTRNDSATKVSILNFDQVDKFVKSYAPAPEKK